MRDRVAEIVMRREPVNAINMQLTREVNAAYRRAKEDPEVRAIILTSACERAFSADMDLADVLQVSFGFPLFFVQNVYYADKQTPMAVTHIEFLILQAMAAAQRIFEIEVADGGLRSIRRERHP